MGEADLSNTILKYVPGVGHVIVEVMTCPNCQGYGMVEDEETDRLVECEVCEGDGFVWSKESDA